MVKIVAQTLKPTFGQINTVFAKAYRPEKHIEDVQIDIIVRARFCNFQAVSRSVWRAISYQMGRTGAQENSQGKAYNFFDRLQQSPCHWTSMTEDRDEI